MTLDSRFILYWTWHIITIDSSTSQADILSKRQEQKILLEPRRRVQVEKFLDMLERKSDDTYQIFLGIMETENPHLHLVLSEDADDDIGLY